MITKDNRFNYCVPTVIQEEGGAIVVRNPKDPGGTTKYGISQRAFPHVDIANLTLDEAEQIYYTDYWVKFNLDQMGKNIDLFLFHACVMSGDEAIKILQTQLKLVDDGVVGPKTLAAVKGMKKVDQLLFLANFGLHLSTLPAFKTFGKGWLSRLFRLTSYAL